MISPSTFKHAWHEDLVRFDSAMLENLKIPEQSKRFLIEAGLPDSAAPFLSFDKSGLPTVADEWVLDKSFRCFRIIGSNSSGDPICIDENANGSIVYLNHDVSFRKVFINSSIAQLAECLLVYRQLVEDTQAENGEDAFIEGNIPKALKNSLYERIGRIDSAALVAGSFWRDDLDSLYKRPT